MADELKPCPFCGGPAITFVYNGATQASCSGGHLSCAGSDVTAPLAMWNRRTPSADADLAVAEAIRRAADVGKVVGDGHYGDEVRAAIHRIAPAEALAEVQRLRARVTSLSEQVDTIAEQRDAALARVERLRHQITEASDPDFIFGAMDNVHDAETTLDDYAAAVSRAIRAALDEETK